MAKLGTKTAPKTAPKSTTAPAPEKAAPAMTLDKLGAGLKKVISMLEELGAKVDANAAAVAGVSETLAALEEAIAQGVEGAEYDDPESGVEAGDDSISADDIRQMKRADLITLINDNEIPIDPTEYQKIGDLRNAIIELIEDAGTEIDEPEGGEENVEDDNW